MPCLPHLSIADGSLNLMMNTYREILPQLGGYLTNKADMHLPRIEAFLQEVGRREPLYFQQRSIDEKDPLYAEEGYKERYYELKFDISKETVPAVAAVAAADAGTDITLKATTESISDSIIYRDSRRDADTDSKRNGNTLNCNGIVSPPTSVPVLVEEYLKGLMWVLSYYHCGCTSWTWFVR